MPTYIEIHSKTDCPFCDKTKDYLNLRKISYKELIYDEMHIRQKMYDTFGLKGKQRTVPQLVLVQEDTRIHLGGYQELIATDLISLLLEE